MDGEGEEHGDGWYYIDNMAGEVQGPFGTGLMLGWVEQGMLEPAALEVRRGEEGEFRMMEEVFPLYSGLTGGQLAEQKKVSKL